MKHFPNLTERDLEILRRSARCYRTTIATIEAEHYGVSATTMRKRLDKLAAAKLLCRLTAWCSEVPAITEPLFEWQPGDSAPDSGAISYKARARWDDNPVREKTIYCASSRTLDLFGLPPRPHLKLTQATHDLGVNRCYWYSRSRWPDLEFVGEDLFAPLRLHGEGVEDAQLVDQTGNVACCIEHIGAYRPDRVEHFHQHVGVERNLPYYLF